MLFSASLALELQLCHQFCGSCILAKNQCKINLSYQDLFNTSKSGEKQSGIKVLIVW